MRHLVFSCSSSGRLFIFPYLFSVLWPRVLLVRLFPCSAPMKFHPALEGSVFPVKSKENLFLKNGGIQAISLGIWRERERNPETRLLIIYPPRLGWQWAEPRTVHVINSTMGQGLCIYRPFLSVCRQLRMINGGPREETLIDRGADERRKKKHNKCGRGNADDQQAYGAEGAGLDRFHHAAPSPCSSKVTKVFSPNPFFPLRR